MPKFGFKGLYAYAAAPGWYFPRGQYLVIGLSPLVVLSVLGVLLMPIVPANLMLSLIAFVVMNATGAVGDIAVCTWLLFKPANLYTTDIGDIIDIYVPGESL